MVWRVALAFLIGCLAGIVVMVAVNVPVYHLGNWPDNPRAYFGFWGVFFGAFAAALSFGLALALLNREVVPRRSAQAHPVAWSLAIAGCLGVVVMAAVNIPVYNSGSWPDHGREILGLFGEIVGLVAASAAFVVTYGRLTAGHVKPRTPSGNGAGLLIASIVAGTFGLLTTWWNVGWGVSLTSQEGLWSWGLAVIGVSVSVLLFIGFRGRRRASPGDRSEEVD